MRDAARALDVDLAVAARGRAAMREAMDDLQQELQQDDPMTQQLAAIAQLVGDR